MRFQIGAFSAAKLNPSACSRRICLDCYPEIFSLTNREFVGTAKATGRSVQADFVAGRPRFPTFAAAFEFKLIHGGPEFEIVEVV